MKYNQELSQIQQPLQTAQNILIVLPAEISIDKLASGLSLFLSLKTAGKNVSIVTEGIIRVGHSDLFGVGQVGSQITSLKGGNLTITLGGVVSSDGKVPALQNLDWAPTGSEKKDLKLTFHVMPGQKFEPTFITPNFEGGGYDLIFAIGSGNLNVLGGVYTSNSQIFSSSQIINIDNQENNGKFGTINIVDGTASSLSEMIGQVILGLNIPYDADTATNILNGIFDATKSLSGDKVGAETYETVANALKVGGKKPNFAEASLGKPVINIAPQITQSNEEAPVGASQGFDLSKIFNAPVNISVPDNFTVPAVVSSDSVPQPSPEETVTGERVESESPEADWLTPKIYSGKGVG
ncbi:MAG: hypothetical protein Q7R97_02480 [Candidatus Daviesbacteria bacterium]|nr:hypothetical protein [Candidatus Daviesbacteria bacterium]